MNIIRPVRLEDEDQLVELVAKSGLGITTLPHSPRLLQKKIQSSLIAFDKNASVDNRKYFFILENLATYKIGGCCGIYAKTGIGERNEFYEVQFEHFDHPAPHQPADLKMLKRVDLHDGPSMLCSLFLSQEFRKDSIGRLLSLSRLMFMGLFPELFTTAVIANLRGFVENNRSPFWDNVGRHFFDVDYESLLKLQETDKNSIPDIIPNSSIYVTLISQEAQESIGKPHPNSLPALKMLEAEGFRCTNVVDPYDAGPMVSAELFKTRTLLMRQTGIVGKLATPKDTAKRMMISNHSFDFRACHGNLDIFGKDLICINDTVANALNVKIGDTIHYVPIH